MKSLSLRVAVWIGVAIHLDWHAARVPDQPRSLGWPLHWLLAVPVFLAAGWYLLRRWPTGFGRPAALSVGLGVLLGQILEPLGETAFGDTFAEVFQPARLWAFATFFAAGLVTLVVLGILADRSPAVR